ncbi:MAG: hypothetical protein JNM94_12150 [Phycisphaerae bacterium]|nr:hypothetical protein [Phycisphaerae bacterium]
MSQSTVSQRLDVPASMPGGTSYRQLAYLEAYDAVLNAPYAFLAYRETDSNGAWRVRIKSSMTAGGEFDPTAIASNARAACAQGKPWFQWGYSFDPSAGDPRCIQFRVHVADNQPKAIEIFAQMRRADGSADAPVSVTFPWPSA